MAKTILLMDPNLETAKEAFQRLWREPSTSDASLEVRLSKSSSAWISVLEAMAGSVGSFNIMALDQDGGRGACFNLKISRVAPSK